MSEEDYEGLMETVHLLKSPANAARLMCSIGEARRISGEHRLVYRISGKGGDAQQLEIAQWRYHY